MGVAVLFCVAGFGAARLRHSLTTTRPPVPVAPRAPERDPRALAVLAGYPSIELASGAPEHGSVRVLRSRLHYVRGGSLVSIRVPRRLPVASLIREAGGVAGLNGTFFSDARVAGTGNKMIGPLLTSYTGEYVPPDPSDDLRCEGRPLVVWSSTHLAIVPYDRWMGESVDHLRQLVPGATDAFLGGGWLVRQGLAQSEEEIRATCVSDAQDFRRRAFMGVDLDGRFVLGATDFSVDSARLARELEKLEIRDAILLDSGFSTSLVWQGRTLVSGHSRRSHPSRPVPHALVVTTPVEASPAPVQENAS